MYNEKISFLDPTLNVNDANFNKPLSQLNDNINFVLNYINGNRSLLPLIFGNLLDYTKDGSKYLTNGGKFDSYKKCHSWVALDNFTIVNDQVISYDISGNRLVYSQVNNDPIQPSQSWIEKEIYIPEQLRTQGMICSIKLGGSSSNSDWKPSNSVTEKVAIQIIGSQQDIQQFHNVGLSENFNYFNYEVNSPEMTTVHIPFNVDQSTSSIKIKIFRISNSNYLHIDSMYVGGFAKHKLYTLNDVDINDIFDFNNNRLHINSTTVMGHTIANSDSISGANKSTLVTFDQLINFTRELLLERSTINVNTETLTGNDFNQLKLTQGQIPLNVGQRIYQIPHGELKNGVVPAPMVSIVAPNLSLNDITGSNNIFFVHSIFDITSTSFKVILSDSPTISGYFLNWTIGNSFSPLDAVSYLPFEKSVTTETSGNGIIFDYEITQDI